MGFTLQKGAPTAFKPIRLPTVNRGGKENKEESSAEMPAGSRNLTLLVLMLVAGDWAANAFFAGMPKPKRPAAPKSAQPAASSWDETRRRRAEGIELLKAAAATRKAARSSTSRPKARTPSSGPLTWEEKKKRREAGLKILQSTATLFKERQARRREELSEPPFASPVEERDVYAPLAASDNGDGEGEASLFTTLGSLAKARVQLAVLRQQQAVEAGINDIAKAPDRAVKAVQAAVDEMMAGMPLQSAAKADNVDSPKL